MHLSLLHLLIFRKSDTIITKTIVDYLRTQAAMTKLKRLVQGVPTSRSSAEEIHMESTYVYSGTLQKSHLWKHITQICAHNKTIYVPKFKEFLCKCRKPLIYRQAHCFHDTKVKNSPCKFWYRPFSVLYRITVNE